VTQPVKTITADTDRNQLQAGQVISPWTVLKGPFVLTDVIGGVQLTVGTGTTCPPTTTSFTSGQGATSGMRIIIPTGSVGCLQPTSGQPAWAGFIPY
jgi:hypothetical protein